MPPNSKQVPWPQHLHKLSECGGGNDGVTHYAISRNAIAHAPSLPKGRARNLLAQVCVVKTFRTGNARREVEILEILSRERSLPFQVCALLNFDRVHYAWMAMSRIPGVNVQIFVRTFESSNRREKGVGKSVPDVFLYHLFIQLGEALRFLHCRKPCPIVHADIFPRNVLVDFSQELFPGLPNIVLIDFGVARVCTEDERITRVLQFGDLRQFCGLLVDIKTKTEVRRTEVDGFFDRVDLRFGLDDCREGPGPVMERVMEEFGEVAIRRRSEGAGDLGDMERIRRHVGSFVETDEKLVKTIYAGGC